MGKKVLIVATSLRRNGNSNHLAEAFAKGAAQAGHQVETVYLCEKNIGFCRGCLFCQKTMRCVIRDDADTIVHQMGAADVLVFATPIYYYGMSGQMKTMLDRANPLFPSDYAFRDIYWLRRQRTIRKRRKVQCMAYRVGLAALKKHIWQAVCLPAV